VFLLFKGLGIEGGIFCMRDFCPPISGVL
jgi:hypothetical protein